MRGTYSRATVPNGWSVPEAAPADGRRRHSIGCTRTAGQELDVQVQLWWSRGRHAEQDSRFPVQPGPGPDPNDAMRCDAPGPGDVLNADGTSRGADTATQAGDRRAVPSRAPAAGFRRDRVSAVEYVHASSRPRAPLLHLAVHHRPRPRPSKQHGGG